MSDSGDDSLSPWSALYQSVPSARQGGAAGKRESVFQMNSDLEVLPTYGH